jgi:hypothetical protein
MREELMRPFPLGHNTDEIIVYHGAARGADMMADRLAKEFLWSVMPVPVNHEKDGTWPMAGNRRNERMLDLADADLVLAFPGPRSRGTWNCVRAAWERGVRVEIPGRG